MNRFEALHALGLGQNATDDDVRRAYYGFVKVVDPEDYAANDRLYRRVDGFKMRAFDAYKYLTAARSHTAGRSGAKGSAALSITATQEKEARLHAWERLRVLIAGYYQSQASVRNKCLIVLAVCILASFILIRRLYGVPRVVGTIVLALAALAAITLISTSFKETRSSLAYVYEADIFIDELKAELAPRDEDEPDDDDGDDGDDEVDPDDDEDE